MKYLQRPFIGLMGALLVALVGGVFVPAAIAQPVPADPPGRVARLADVSGQAWLYSPDSAEWAGAGRNQPLTSGDRLATDPGAHAELQVGSTSIRLDASTELEVVQLDDERISLQLHGGSITTRLRNAADAGEFEVTTEDGRFVFQRAGRYRIDRDRPSSHITVYAGQAGYEGPGSALTVTQGQRAEFWLDSSNAAQYNLSEPVNDEFAAWNSERDRSADRAVAPRYVSPEMTGVEELERYGRWEQSPDYGALWIPRGVAVGWAPYSTGHWAYVRPWGWTWIDDAPWGFAPFHYGRWVYFRNSWCWAPGQRVARPVYAPALVAWVGGPRVNVSVSVGIGPAVGWFPLAPREVYVPSYRVSPRYVQNINITHVTNVTHITTVINNPQAPREFYNRRLPNAVTVVPATVLTARQPVAPAAAQLRNAPWVREITNQPRHGETMVVAPVVAPMAPVQGAERRPVAPPPGVTVAPRAPREISPRPRVVEPNRPQAPEPGRGGERRPGSRDEGGRPDTPQAPRPVAGPAPVAPAATTPAPAMNPAPVQRPAPEAPGRRPEPGQGDDRRNPAGRGEVVVPPVRPVAPVQQPAAPLVRPAPQTEPTPRPAPAPAAAEAPARRAPPQAEERRPVAPVRAEPTPRPPPQRVEAPAPARPAEPAPAAKPAEAPHQPAPDARRPEPPARAKAEAVRDERRGDAKGERGDKKD